MSRLYLFAASFAAGILVASACSLPLSYSLFAALLAGALFAYQKIFKVDLPAFAIFLLILFGFALGAARMTLEIIPKPDPLAVLANKTVMIQGVVAEDPDERESYTQIIIDADKEISGAREFAAREKILAQMPIQSHLKYGDEVKISGKLAKPENFKTDNGRRFDYVNYLAKSGIRYEVGFADGTVESRGHGNFVVAKLYDVKHAFEHAISSVLPDPQGALENGILLGAKQSLGSEILSDFNRASLSHVVVLSGYNVALVAKTAQWLFQWLPRGFGLGAGAVFIVLFALLAGGGASVLRAALMALIALLGKANRRDVNILRALILSSILMVLQNPKIVAYDPSFQLSFIATFGLVAVSPLIAPHFKFVTEKFELREIVTSTLAAQLFVLPFLIYMNGLFSILAFPANLLVLPAVPSAMLIGFFTALLALVSHTLAIVPAFGLYLLLSYMLALTHFFANAPIGIFIIQTFPVWALGLWYAIYGLILWWWHSKPRATAEEAQKFDTSMAFEIVEEISNNG